MRAATPPTMMPIRAPVDRGPNLLEASEFDDDDNDDDDASLPLLVLLLVLPLLLLVEVGEGDVAVGPTVAVCVGAESKADVPWAFGDAPTIKAGLSEYISVASSSSAASPHT